MPVRTAVAGKAGIHKAQAVQKFCARAESAAYFRYARPLVQGKGGGNVQYFVYARPGSLGHSAAGIGGERLQVSSRALGIQHSERQ